MTYRAFIWCMSFATALAWLSWVAVLFSVNPYETSFLGHAAFYITLFIALVGSSSLIGTWLRVHVMKRGNLVLREVKIAVRHGILLSFMTVITLAFSLLGWLTWWSFALLLAALGGVEYLALLVQEGRRT